MLWKEKPNFLLERNYFLNLTSWLDSVRSWIETLVFKLSLKNLYVQQTVWTTARQTEKALNLKEEDMDSSNYHLVAVWC